MMACHVMPRHQSLARAHLTLVSQAGKKVPLSGPVCYVPVTYFPNRARRKINSSKN